MWLWFCLAWFSFQFIYLKIHNQRRQTSLRWTRKCPTLKNLLANSTIDPVIKPINMLYFTVRGYNAIMMVWNERVRERKEAHIGNEITRPINTERLQCAQAFILFCFWLIQVFIPLWTLLDLIFMLWRDNFESEKLYFIVNCISFFKKGISIIQSACWKLCVKLCNSNSTLHGIIK